MKRKVLAVASSGGHWIQLMRVKPAFQHHEVHWVSTIPGLAEKVPVGNYSVVKDASMWDKMGLLVCFVQIAFVVAKIRPDIVITTGAAPGFFAIICGRFWGARTIWLDSIANADELSLAGRYVGRWSNVWLTQWPELAEHQGPHYIGAVF